MDELGVDNSCIPYCSLVD